MNNKNNPNKQGKSSNNQGQNRERQGQSGTQQGQQGQMPKSDKFGKSGSESRSESRNVESNSAYEEEE